MKVIYAVTVFQKISHEQLFEDPTKYIPSFGDHRCVGWFDNFPEAKCAVENNFSNMHDNMYEYAIIESYEPGILLPETSRTLFKWNTNNSQYEPIEIPIELSKISNFGIG